MDKECMICLEEDRDFVSMPCAHEVCTSCHNKLINSSNECPFCRSELQKKGEIPEYRIIVIRPQREEVNHHNQRASVYCFCVLCLCTVLIVILILNPILFLMK
jgi:hypothetical protein